MKQSKGLRVFLRDECANYDTFVKSLFKPQYEIVETL
jgi:hypothetical protein